MNVEYAEALVFRLDLSITPHRKIDLENFVVVFFKTMVGIFCATCTVTGYYCFHVIWSPGSIWSRCHQGMNN